MTIGPRHNLHRVRLIQKGNFGLQLMQNWLWGVLALFSSVSSFAVRPELTVRQGTFHRGQRCVHLAAMSDPVDEQGYLVWLSRKIERSQRPPPVKIRRAGLSKNFAVLLMRTSYQVFMA